MNAANMTAGARGAETGDAPETDTTGTRVAPSGRQFVLSGGGYHAVVTEVGAGLRELTHDGPHGNKPLILSYGVHEPAHSGAGQLLAPWPNRVAEGRYRFDGEERQLDLSEPTRRNAIHGLVRWSPWHVEEHDANRVVLTHRLFPHPGYPHTLDLIAVYSLDEAGLEVEVTARNIGASVAPYAYAAHPYLIPGVDTEPGAIDQWTLHLPTSRRVESDDRMNPVGLADVDGTGYDFRAPKQLGDAVMDTAFGGLQRELDGLGRVRMSEPGGGCVTLWMDRGLDWIQVFTADPLAGAWQRAAVAVEPMSAPPDAFNSGTDLIRLEPGVAVGHRWGIHAG